MAGVEWVAANAGPFLPTRPLRGTRRTACRTAGSYNEAEAYLYFSRACLEYLRQSGRQPDVVHVHEWQVRHVCAAAACRTLCSCLLCSCCVLTQRVASRLLPSTPQCLPYASGRGPAALPAPGLAPTAPTLAPLRPLQAAAVPMLFWDAPVRFSDDMPRTKIVMTIHNMDSSGECRWGHTCG